MTHEQDAIEVLRARLAKAASMHAETCLYARGVLTGPAVTCSMCDVLGIKP